MKHLIFTMALFTTLGCSQVWAKSTIDYIGTGGIKFIQHPAIAMQSEDLFISKKRVRATYQFKNTSKKDVTETIIFTLPKAESIYDAHNPDTGALTGSLTFIANGKTIKPTQSVRAYLHPIKADGTLDKLKFVEMTTEFKECGFTSSELMNPWTRAYRSQEIATKRLANCSNEKVQAMIRPYIESGNEIQWFADMVYGWKQTFKADKITAIRTSYKPLVGKGDEVANDTLKVHCAGSNIRNLMATSTAKIGNNTRPPFSEMIYVMGANNIKPIEEFKLTIERDADEIVTFCWNGETKKISDTRFEMTQKNFIPKQHLGILFIKMK